MNRRSGKFWRIIQYLQSYRRLILLGVFSLVVTDLLALIPPWLIKEAIDSLPSVRSAAHLLPYFLAIVLVVAAQALFRYAWRNSLFGVSRMVEYHLRADLFLHLQGMDKAFFLKRSVGDLMSRCTNDLVAIQELIAFFGLLVVDSSLTIGTCLVLMAIIDLPLTIASLLPLPFLSLCFLHFGRNVRLKSSEVQKGLAKLTDVVQETLSGMRVVQSYAMEAARRKIYEDTIRDYIRKNVELAKTRGLFWALLGLLTGTAAVIVLWIGGSRVLDGYLSLGGFVAFATYLTMLSWPMMSLGFMVNLLQRGKASMERIEEIFAERPAISHATRSAKIDLAETEPGVTAERVDVDREVLGPFLDTPGSYITEHCPVGAVSTPRKPGKIGNFFPRDAKAARGLSVGFHSVCFRYPGSNRWALFGVNFTVPAGGRLGITGPVGGGKTTALELIPRIYEPTAGLITLDGRDIRSLSLKGLRRSMGWVGQEPFLFSDTVLENVRFGAPWASPESLEWALEVARLDKDLDVLPKGLETLIGERGVMLSGGQRQRVALARALMVAPRLLLLDDAFAHLDAETETEVMANIIVALPATTIIFISHRVSSLLAADHILVLADGQILEEGPPQTLASSGGYFHRICRQQAIIDELEQIGREGPR